MWKCIIYLVFMVLVSVTTEDEDVRENRALLSKNFFGGVWGNRPPLIDGNLRTVCSCKCGERNEVSRIVGGEEAGINELPWMVKLIYFKRFYCGGMLINDRYVLSAAHCVKGVRFKLEEVNGLIGKCIFNVLHYIDNL